MHQMAGAKGTDGLAVFSILYDDAQRSNPVLDPFWSDVFYAQPVINGVDVAAMVAQCQNSTARGAYYSRYTGSLTTPPCTPGVSTALIRRWRGHSQSPENVCPKSSHPDSVRFRLVQVKWHVCVSTVGVNPVQALSYRYALNGIENFRPAQPRNGRVPLSYVNST